MYETYLAHHGIKGQRWGIRRFQKKDGTRTPAGKKRYDSDGVKKNVKRAIAIGGAAAVVAGTVASANAAKHRYENKQKLLDRKKAKLDAREKELDNKTAAQQQHQNVTNASQKGQQKGNNSPDKLESVKRAVDASNTIVNTTKTTIRAVSDTQPKYKKMDLSKMTDNDLRNAINRYDLEQRYTSIYGTKEASRGKKAVNTALEIGGGVLATTSSALTIALAIKQLKH